MSDAAFEAERRNDVVSAVAAYEASYAESSLDSLIDLAVLYWQITDFGFWTARGLPKALVSTAGVRLDEVLRDADERFPGAPQVEFWRRYIAWADLGESLTVEECRRLMQQNPRYLEPAMFIFATSGGRDCDLEAHELLKAAKDRPTARNRYLASVVEGTLARRAGRG